MNTEIAKALTEIIRNHAIKKNSVNIEGLGTFRAVHRKQHQAQYQNGRVLLIPPKDYLTFTPNKD